MILNLNNYADAKQANVKPTISYRIGTLNKKIPILIAIYNRTGTPSMINEDLSTDHFIVIVAMENISHFTTVQPIGQFTRPVQKTSCIITLLIEK